MMGLVLCLAMGCVNSATGSSPSTGSGGSGGFDPCDMIGSDTDVCPSAVEWECPIGTVTPGSGCMMQGSNADPVTYCCPAN